MRGEALQLAAPEVKNDRSVIIAAAGLDCFALQFASSEMQADKEVVLAAMKHDGQALQFAF